MSEVMVGVTFHWRFNGVPLESERSQTLTFDDVTASENGGVYECFAFNAAGNGSDTATVLFSPLITVHPVNQTAFNGSENVGFNCSATGFPLPTIQWLKVDSQSLPASSFYISSGGTSTLILQSVEFGDEGYYQCSASALNTTTSSNIATLYSK